MTKLSLEQHKRKVHTDKSFKCLDCDQTFKENGGLLRHSSTVHNTEQIPCELCNISFKSNRTFKKHNKEKHNSCYTDPENDDLFIDEFLRMSGDNNNYCTNENNKDRGEYLTLNS